jgi:hypothetical protein
VIVKDVGQHAPEETHLGTKPRARPADHLVRIGQSIHKPMVKHALARSIREGAEGLGAFDVIGDEVTD